MAAGFLLIGSGTLIIEFVIWARVNRHLVPEQRIRIHSLRDVSTWFGREGLLARYERLYPASRLASFFRALWVLFFAVFGALIVYAKMVK